MTAEGIIHFVGTPEQIGDRTKITLVIDCAVGDSQYPHYLAIDFWGERSDSVKTLSLGDLASVEYSIRSRSSKSNPEKWFTHLTGFSVEKLSPALKAREDLDDDEVMPF